MPRPKRSENVRLKSDYLKAREKYLAGLRKAIKPNVIERTMHDTARTLEGLKLQHKFMVAERKRLERTIARLGERGKTIDPRFIKRLKKVKKEDKEAQARFKLIKDYFENEMKEAK